VRSGQFRPRNAAFSASQGASVRNDAGERFLAVQLHELLIYLNQQGVATLLIGAHQGLIGANMTTPVDASYLADAVLLLRYL
jgi:hypothetical protein